MNVGLRAALGVGARHRRMGQSLAVIRRHVGAPDEQRDEQQQGSVLRARSCFAEHRGEQEFRASFANRNAKSTDREGDDDLADAHWASDVIAGVALGFGVGYGVPYRLHYGEAGPKPLGAGFLPKNTAVAPLVSNQVIGLAFNGAW